MQSDSQNVTDLHRDVPDPDGANARTAIRVLHVLPSLFGGGMERATIRLVRGLGTASDAESSAFALEQGLVVMGNADSELLVGCPPSLESWVLGMEGAPDGEDRRQRWAWWHLRKQVRHFRPHVIHARSTGVWMDAALAKPAWPGARLVLGFHGRTDLNDLPWRRRLRNRRAARRADRIVAVSRHAATMLSDDWGLPADKVLTLPNGVDANRYHPSQIHGARRQIRARINCDPAEHLAVCVANLYPIKGLDVLIKAWARVCRTDPLARLLVVGEGPLGRALPRLARDLGCLNSVTFLGRREDVDELLRAADLFVLPSRYEGCNNALLEAMATGLTCVATHVGGNAELIEHKQTGLLVPPEDPKELADAILHTLREHSVRMQFGRAAREAVCERFSFDAWVQRHVQLYAELAGHEMTAAKASAGESSCAG